MHRIFTKVLLCSLLLFSVLVTLMTFLPVIIASISLVLAYKTGRFIGGRTTLKPDHKRTRSAR